MRAVCVGVLLLVAYASPSLAAEVRIVTIPDGAEVWLEGVRLGVTGKTGLRLVGTATGTYKYSIRKTGFASVERAVQVQSAEETVTVVVRLQGGEQGAEEARDQPPQHPLTRKRAEESGPGPQKENGGSKALPILLATVGALGAGTAAVFATRDEQQANRAPSARIVASPEGIAIVLTTVVSLTAVAADPDGDALTYRWDFGDQALGLGETVTHVFPTVGTFNASVTVSDGKTESVTTRQVVVGNLVGTWKPSASVRGEIGYEIVATTPSLPGSVFFSDGSRVGLLPRSMATDPRAVLLQYFDRRLGQSCLVSLTGQADTSLRTIAGILGCTGCGGCGPVSITLIRQ